MARCTKKLTLEPDPKPEPCANQIRPAWESVLETTQDDDRAHLSCSEQLVKDLKCSAQVYLEATARAGAVLAFLGYFLITLWDFWPVPFMWET